MSTASISGRSREPWRSKEMQSLFETIGGLRTAAEARAFLRDLCTVSELEAMAHRWEVAQLVDAGLPYLEVAARSGASTTTVTRVANSLRYGQNGYRLALDRQSSAPTQTSATKEKSSAPATPQAPQRGKKTLSHDDRGATTGRVTAGARRPTSQQTSTPRRGARSAPASG